MTGRQRVRFAGHASGAAARTAAGVIGAFVLVYAVALALLALKVSPATIDAITGYRSVLNFLEDLRAADATSTVRLIAAALGVASALVFGWLAWRELPRPRLARHPEQLSATDLGVLRVRPRAIERAAETAARHSDDVKDAKARLDEHAMVLEITITSNTDLDTLVSSCVERVANSFGVHGLPTYAVELTISDFERSIRKGPR